MATFTVSNNADDGYCRTPQGDFFSASGNALPLGKTTTTRQHCFVRFTNVTIPPGSEILSAALRFTAAENDSSTTVNLNIYFENADNPSAPVSGSDLVGRSLTSNVGWSSVGSWTQGSTYDSPELKTILQTVVDRPGFLSGNSVIAHVIDNFSSDSARRQPATNENTSYTAVQLIVTYSAPRETDESFAVSDTVDAQDLYGDENESFGASDTIDGEIEVEAVEDSFSSSDVTDAEITHTPIEHQSPVSDQFLVDCIVDSEILGAGEAIDNFGVDDTIDALITTSPLSESFDMDDSINGVVSGDGRLVQAFGANETTDAYVEKESDAADSFLVGDTIDCFNYSAWIRQNKDKAITRFLFTLTGSADATTDVVIPIASFYAEKKTGYPTYLQVVVHGFDYAEQIADRLNGDMIIHIGYEINNQIDLQEQILIVDLEDIELPQGPENRSIVIRGRRTSTYKRQRITIEKPLYKNSYSGELYFRFNEIDPYLNPGDTLVSGSDEITVNNITYIVGEENSTMEIREGV